MSTVRDFMMEGSLVLAITSKGFKTKLYCAPSPPCYRRDDEGMLPYPR